MTSHDVAVVGLGLIGGSLAAALRRRGSRVAGFDRNPDHMRVAEERALADRTCGSLEEAVREAELVIVAVPVLAVGPILEQADAHARSEALLLDTGSVKGLIVDAMRRLRFPARAVGGHPIAGKERSGPAAADPDLFAGRPFVLTPTDRTSDQALDRARALVDAVGAVPTVMDAASHDRILARTSHLPQLLATALAAGVTAAEARLAGPAFHDMTRLAASDPDMWRDIFSANRENVTRAARSYLTELEALVRSLESGEDERLLAAMRRGSSAIESLEKRVPV